MLTSTILDKLSPEDNLVIKPEPIPAEPGFILDSSIPKPASKRSEAIAGKLRERPKITTKMVNDREQRPGAAGKLKSRPSTDNPISPEEIIASPLSRRMPNRYFLNSLDPVILPRQRSNSKESYASTVTLADSRETSCFDPNAPAFYPDDWTGPRLYK